jgi:hypothetical protein
MNQHQNNVLSSRRAEIIAILLLLAIQLAFGMATLSNHGESWDEARLYEYGEQSINAYRALFDPGIPVDFGDDDLRYYGPAYFMGMSLLVRAASLLFPQTLVIDLWHLGNFACLQFGLLCFYFLLRRFLDGMPSLATTALFASQPLIWGHGFINPKDIPFMAFFTASILFGLNMLDEYERKNFELGSLFRNRWFYLAALVLGLTISIRILGFAAAFIVLFYFAFINIRKVLRLSYPYLGLALVVSFLTWPYLWAAPVSYFIQGIYAMLKFQWVGQVLFNGMYFSSNQLPREYVPQLLVMQMTETALALSLFGTVVILARQTEPKYRQLVILFIPWFVIPILYILLNGMNLYDNTRQLMFVLPGAFLVAGIGTDYLFSRIKPMAVQLVLLFLMVLPGLAGILRFHPYEYTYYNFLTTSSVEIHRNYETDYWATSFKEISAYLNDQSPEHSLVIAWGPDQLIERYARPDLQVRSFDDLEGVEYSTQPYYLVLTTRYDMDLKIFPSVRPIYAVEHNESVYSVIKYISP